jgi:hypothetical protein
MRGIKLKRSQGDSISMVKYIHKVNFIQQMAPTIHSPTINGKMYVASRVGFS